MQQITRVGLVILAGLVLGSIRFAHSQQTAPPTPKEILLAADTACLQVKSIIYDSENEIFNSGETIAITKAMIYQQRANVPEAGPVPGKYFISGTFRRSDRSPLEFVYSYNGSVFRLLEPSTKSVLVVNSPKAYTVGQMLGSEKGLVGSIGSFTSADPFKWLINEANKLEYLGTTEVNGTLCHKIQITRTINGGGRTTTVVTQWFFGTEDYLPRRIENANSRTTVTNLRINPVIDEAKFYLKIPDGYRESVVTGKAADNKGLLTPGSSAPEWSLPDATGRMVSLKDYRGKIVLLDFWGTWCVPCIKAMPRIQAIHDAYKDRGVIVIGVAVHDEEGDPIAFFKQHKYSYGLLLHGDEVAKGYQVEAMPAVYIIGADGKILHAESGGRENMETEVRDIIDRALQDRRP